MILAIILTFMFKSFLCNPFNTSGDLPYSGDFNELTEIYETIEDAVISENSSYEVIEVIQSAYETIEGPVKPESSYATTENPDIPDSTTYQTIDAPITPDSPKCKVYEETIKQIYELEHVRNSTCRAQYKRLRDKIDDLFLFDICYERACMITMNSRNGRQFLADIFVGINKVVDGIGMNLEKTVVVNDYDYWEDNFCNRNRNDFCRTCPSRSDCCRRWCW